MTINAPGFNPLEVGGPAAGRRRPQSGDAFPTTDGLDGDVVCRRFHRLGGSGGLLLTVHLSAIAGAEAASAFSIVTGVAALLGLIAQPLTGRFSDRSRARLGKRRGWISWAASSPLWCWSA